MSKIAYACLTAAGLLAAFPAHAQTSTSTGSFDVADATTLDDLVVTANRSAQRADRIGSSVSVLTQEAIESQQTVAVADLLTTAAGVNFTSNGGLGKSSSLSIRGSENQHTVVLIDGIKLNDPSAAQGGFNFSNLMVGAIERIEVLRGAQSTLWGSQAIGGVVNIITARPVAPLEGSVDLEAGSLDTIVARASIGGREEGLTWRVSGSRTDTGGISSYRTGTEKDGFKNNGLSGRLRYEFSDALSIDLRSVWSDGWTGFDAWDGDSPEYGTTEELVSYAGVNFDLFEGLLSNRLGYAHTETRRENYNPTDTIQPLSFESKGENTRFEYQGILTFSPDLTATIGAETETSKMRSRSPAGWNPDPAFVRGQAGIDTVYGQVQWTIGAGLTLTTGLRRDDHQAFGENTLGQIAAAWSLNDGNTVFRASVGQGFRAPSLYELYSEYGNLSLRPESFDSWEIGVEQRLLSRVVLNLTYFNREGEDEIRYNGCATPTDDPLCTVNGIGRWGYYMNIQATKAQGVELATRIEVTPELSLDANYSWTEAQYASGFASGNQLNRRPEHMANLTASYRWPGDLNTGLSVRYVGESFEDAANTIPLGAYTLVDFRASYPINDWVEVYGRVQNLFDEEYETILNYGTTGRTAYVGVRFRY